MVYITKKRQDALVQFRIDKRYLATGLRFLIEQKYPVRFMSDIVRTIFVKGVESLIKEGEVEFIETTEDAGRYLDHYLSVNLNPSGRGITNLGKNLLEEGGPTHILPNATTKQAEYDKQVAIGTAALGKMAENVREKKEGRVLTDTSAIVSTPEQVEKAKDRARNSEELEIESEEDFEDYENGQIRELSELDTIPDKLTTTDET